MMAISSPESMFARNCGQISWAVLVALLLGCGSGEYERRMQQSLTRLHEGGAQLGQGGTLGGSDLLYAQPTPIPETNISIRLPTMLGQGRSWAEGVVDETTGQPIDENRLEPPFTALPGFRFCYEVFTADSTGQQWPAYMYVAVEDAQATSQLELMSTIQQDLVATFPAAPEEWSVMELTGPNDTKLTCLRTSVIGPQQFDSTSVGGNLNEVEGHFVLYLYSTDTHHVMIGWRAIPSIVESSQFFPTAELSVATLQAGP